MAKFVPTAKPDTMVMRADMVGSTTGGMFLVSFVVEGSTVNMPPLLFFVTYQLAESRGEG
jgi:hypothetical protein